jgi:anaerobic ribonucleoside-triphosphate reductase
MAISNGCFAAIACFGLMVSVGLTGCSMSALKEHTGGWVETTCQIAVRQGLERAQETYVNLARQKCEQLRDLSSKSRHEGETFLQKCLNTTAVIIDEERVRQRNNYTEECVAHINGANWKVTEVGDMVKKFFAKTNMTASMSGAWEKAEGEVTAESKKEADASKTERLFASTRLPVVGHVASQGHMALAVICVAFATVSVLAAVRSWNFRRTHTESPVEMEALVA